MKKLNGLPVNVLRAVAFGDHTNGGVTGRMDRFILVDPGKALGPFEADNEQEGRLALVVTAGPFGLLRAVMADDETGKPLPGPTGEVGPMFGGNYITTSDGRFPADYPIPVHDRYETPETYRRLTT